MDSVPSNVFDQDFCWTCQWYRRAFECFSDQIVQILGECEKASILNSFLKRSQLPPGLIQLLVLLKSCLNT